MEIRKSFLVLVLMATACAHTTHKKDDAREPASDPMKKPAACQDLLSKRSR